MVSVKKINILHIIKDDKFCDPVFSKFEKDNRINNFSIIMVTSKYKLKYIKKTEKLTILYTEKQLKHYLEKINYDVIFFYSLQCDKYHYFKYIPKNVIVIWWCWGTELYSEYYGMKPFISLDVYKKQTKTILNKNNDYLFFLKKIVNKLFRARYYKKLRKRALERIDYFQPVISVEYDIMQSIDSFRAKEFYYPHCLTFFPEKFKKRNEYGSILFGNSANPYNNHLDVWQSICDYLPCMNKIIIPLSYGYKDYSILIRNNIKSSQLNISYLTEFLSPINYFNIVSECSYAVFGVIRQHSMGNINYCLRNGIKIFLYKDSMVYQYLKRLGYKVFTIEGINEKSFLTPLSQSDHEINCEIYIKEQLRVQKIGDESLSEIIKKIKEK